MSRRLAVPDLAGQCAVCSQTLPATPAAEYQGKVRLVVHDHPRAELGRCIGSRMLTSSLPRATGIPVRYATEGRRAS